jgi:hypothetical protein
MNEDRRLGIGEFLTDVRMVITSPAERFSVIHERGALWGSLLLLVAPAYFGFTFAGGVYFERDPFLGYSFILPAVIATIVQLLRVYIIHFFAHLFEDRERRLAAPGEFRGLLVVFGYASVPSIISIILVTAFFGIGSQRVAIFFREYRAISISIMFASGIAFFLWDLILLVLAMRRVYALRDAKIIGALLIGFIVAALLAMSVNFVVMPATADLVYLQPILSEKIIGVFKTDPTDNPAKDARISFQADVLSYRFKSPTRFELVAFTPANAGGQEKQGRMSGRHLVVGRIAGLPGDEVELSYGKLWINGLLWAEPYILPEFQTTVSLKMRRLGPDEYIILPEDRRLLDNGRAAGIVVKREQIFGRFIVNRWPIGWGIYRPSIFLQAHPVSNAPMDNLR